jgi:hypothetical protein
MSKGLATAATLIVIALACLTVVRKLERERSLLAKLQARGAVDSRNDLSLDELSEGERDVAESLAAAGVLSLRQNRCHIRTAELSTFRHRRVRLTLSGALGALVLAGLLAALILHR